MMWFCDCVLIECVGLCVGEVLLGSVVILLSRGLVVVLVAC